MVIKYLLSLLKHKWFVFVECVRLGIPFLGVIHDLSKFSPAEFFKYARWFYGESLTHTLYLTEGVGMKYRVSDVDGQVQNYIVISCESPPEDQPPQIVYSRLLKDKINFDIAWLHHQKRNRHHWQYWMLWFDSDMTTPLASFEHDQWSGWMQYLFSKCDHSLPKVLSALNNESVIIPAQYVKNLRRQMSTPYAKLPDNEQQSDIAEVHKLFRALEQFCLPMPDRYRREMLADWRGAGRAYGNPDTKAWYLKNKENIILYPDTRAWIERELGV